MSRMGRTLGRTVPKQSAMMSSADGIEKKALVSPADVALTVGSGIYGKVRLSSILGATADTAIIGAIAKALTGKKAREPQLPGI